MLQVHLIILEETGIIWWFYSHVYEGVIGEESHVGSEVFWQVIDEKQEKAGTQGQILAERRTLPDLCRMICHLVQTLVDFGI